MRLRVLTVILVLLSISCSGANTERRNAELVVTYDDKEVHRASPIFTSKDEFTKELENSGEKYIIFSAPWCPPCTPMLRALEQSGHIDKVTILNLEEPWVAYLFKATNLSVVPTLLVADSSGLPKTIVQGASPIVMHLIINIDTD